MVDIDSVRLNERVKASRGCATTQPWHSLSLRLSQAFTKADLYLLLDIGAGLILISMAWHMRALLQSEEIE